MDAAEHRKLMNKAKRLLDAAKIHERVIQQQKKKLEDIQVKVKVNEILITLKNQ